MRQVETSSDLDEWLNAESEITDFEKQQALFFQKKLNFNVHNWNEMELDTHFIGPIFTIVDFSSYEFNHFAQREFQGFVDDYRLYGKPDSMVASGRREPEIPYFSFQEYKKELDPNGDPAAQALAAMLAAQHMEEEIKTMYGCYVVGSVWKFMVLKPNRHYCISALYDALNNDIFDIIRILKNLKAIVRDRIA
jgi:hypothetical protein